MRPYDDLDKNEKDFVDDVVRGLFDEATGYGFRLAGDDRCERFVDAFATWVIESRNLK